MFFFPEEHRHEVCHPVKIGFGSQATCQKSFSRKFFAARQQEASGDSKLPWRLPPVATGFENKLPQIVTNCRGGPENAAPLHFHPVSGGRNKGASLGQKGMHILRMGICSRVMARMNRNFTVTQNPLKRGEAACFADGNNGMDRFESQQTHYTLQNS